MKSENLNFLEPSGPVQACNGTALPFYSLDNFCLWARLSSILGRDKRFVPLFQDVLPDSGFQLTSYSIVTKNFPGGGGSCSAMDLFHIYFYTARKGMIYCYYPYPSILKPSTYIIYTLTGD